MRDQFFTTRGHVHPTHRCCETTARRRQRGEAEMVEEPAGPDVKRVRHEECPTHVERTEAVADVVHDHARSLTEAAHPGKRDSDILLRIPPEGSFRPDGDPSRPADSTCGPLPV